MTDIGQIEKKNIIPIPPMLQSAFLTLRSAFGTPARAASERSLDEICDELIYLQRRRVYCIKSQSRCDRSIEAHIVQLAGYTEQWEKKDREAAYAFAKKVRLAIERDRYDALKETLGSCLLEVVSMVLGSAQSRKIWDDRRDEVERRMMLLASLTPVWHAWALHEPGLSPKGLGALIGEAGNLSNYPNPAKLWKRYGIGVIGGRRQGNPAASKPTKEDWIMHGYNRRRRSEVWVFFEALLKTQARGVTKHGAIPGTYARIFYERKEREVSLNEAGAFADIAAKRLSEGRVSSGSKPYLDDGRLPPGQINARASRYACKAFVRDLWVAWQDASWPMPLLIEPTHLMLT